MDRKSALKGPALLQDVEQERQAVIVSKCTWSRMIRHRITLKYG